METYSKNISQNDLIKTPQSTSFSGFSSARSIPSSRNDENFTQNIEFPYTKQFLKLDQKEKEKIFTALFEEKLSFIRNKELKCVNSPITLLSSSDEINLISELRTSCLEQKQQQECKKQLTQRTTIAADKPPHHLDSDYSPSYDPLLNTNFNAQFTVLETFKSLISSQLVDNRVKRRMKQLQDYLKTSPSKSLSRLTYTRPNTSQSVNEQLTNTQTLQGLLSINPVIEEKCEKFTEKEEYLPVEYPEISIEPHAIERPFDFYSPTIIEKYALTPFSRTDVNAFIHIPVSPPEIYPVVKGEQPINEIISSIHPTSGQIETPANDLLSAKSSSRSLKSKTFSTSSILPFVPQQVKIIQYPREIKFFDSDPIAELQTGNINLPDLDIEIGRSSILSMPINEYQPMMLTGRAKNVSPFKFTGLPDQFANVKYPKPMTKADPVDLRELEFDDDIDNIDVSYKPKQPSDFMTKPVETKNKSHVYSQAVNDGQTKYAERQKKQVQELESHIKIMNDLIHDKTLKIKTDDLKEYLKM